LNSQEKCILEGSHSHMF